MTVSHRGAGAYVSEGGVADSSFEGAIDAFLRDANGYVANLKTAVR